MSAVTDRSAQPHRPPAQPRLHTQLLALAPAARPYLLLAIVAAVSGAALAIVQAALLSHVVAEVFLGRQGVAGIAILLAGLIGVAVLRCGALAGAEMLGQLAACRVKRTVRDRLAAALLDPGPLGLRAERTGELATALGEGVEALDEYVRSYLVLLVVAVLGPLLVLGIYAAVDPISAVALLLIAPFIPLLMVLIGLRTRDLMDRRWAELGRMSAHFLDMLQGLYTLKLFGQSAVQGEQIEQVSLRYARRTMDVLKVAFQSSLILDLSATMGVALVAIEVGSRLLLRALDFEQALFVLLLAPEFFLPLRQFVGARHARLSAESAGARVLELIGDRSAPPEDSEVEIHGDIVLEDVYYTPPERRDAVLRGVDLRLREGQTTALLGPSGSGKSTVANLLLRFLEPDRGTLRAGRVDLGSIGPAAWRRRIAFVSQQPHIFQGTVAENIRLGKPGATHAEVVAAARDACVDEFVRRLPDGYETQVGEHGARLSGGQRQRLALARAFLQDRPIMVLDEPTANMDAPLSARVWESVRRRSRDRTVLLITHDPKLAEQANCRIRLLEGSATQESLV